MERKNGGKMKEEWNDKKNYRKKKERQKEWIELTGLLSVTEKVRSKIMIFFHYLQTNLKHHLAKYCRNRKRNSVLLIYYN